MNLTFRDQLTRQFWSFIWHAPRSSCEIVGIPDCVDNYLKIEGAPGSLCLPMSMRYRDTVMTSKDDKTTSHFFCISGFPVLWTVSSSRHDSVVFPVKYSIDQGAQSLVTMIQCLISEVELVVVKYRFSFQTKSNHQSVITCKTPPPTSWNKNKVTKIDFWEYLTFFSHRCSFGTS